MTSASTLRDLITERIRASGPLTFAEYMELALYHPEHGYYARADRRSGRAGDFFTSVDVGPLFGELLAKQFAQMWRILGPQFDLVEAGAGNGRLARDVLDAAARLDRPFYDAVRLHLVERSPAARAAQPDTLGPHAPKIASTGPTLPPGLSGVIYANELLDALPTHLVRMDAEGLRELYVDCADDTFVEREGPPSSPAIEQYFERINVQLEPDCRAEVCLAAAAWIREAASSLDRGFLLLIDYGHRAEELYAQGHGNGTVRTYRSHHVNATRSGDPTPWLTAPGVHDITSHVDLTTIESVACEAGLDPVATLDQSYFLMGLGALDRPTTEGADDLQVLKERLALKTLLLPGGLGSTHKVLIFGKRVGRPVLKGTSYKVRMT